MEFIERSGECHRVADPSWQDPLSGAYSMRFGGRWNAPGSFPVVYLNADIPTARANARRHLTEQLRGYPYGAQDLDPSELPVLVSTDLPQHDYLDIVTDGGIDGVGLPVTYPKDSHGDPIPHEPCREIGQHAWDAGLSGIACRSAATTAPPNGEEVAWFDRHEEELKVKKTRSFAEWYGDFDW